MSWALAAARARGRQLGDPKLGAHRAAQANAFARRLRATVAPLAKQGLSSRDLARALNERGVTAPGGGSWQSRTILRLLDRLGLR